jgi:hypothetical protein
VLQYNLQLSSNDVVEVVLDRQANVLLMDSVNLSSYKRGDRFTYYGGLARVSPAHLSAPYSGSWYVVLDFLGYTGSVRAGVRALRRR